MRGREDFVNLCRSDALKSIDTESKYGIINLLRWGVAALLFGERQSSSRKEISRLPEIKSKTIAFIKRWSFLLCMYMEAFVIIQIADCILHD